MSKRRIWGDRQPISGADLTDIGLYEEQNLGALALATGPGILQGLTAVQTATPSASLVVRPGFALVHDPSVGRPRLVELPLEEPLSFAGKSPGVYALVLTAQEQSEDERTIVPPPPGHPFYEPGAQPYQIHTLRRWIAGLSLQAVPYTPVGAQTILASVTWGGASIQNGDITRVLWEPTPLVADEGLRPSKLHRSLAGPGLGREADGTLGVRVDETVFTLGSGRITLRDGGVSDTALGLRRIQPAALPGDASQTTTLSLALGWLARALTGVTGQAAWNEAPDTTLAELHRSAARKAADETVSGHWQVTGSLSLPQPSAGGHAATKAYVDSVVAGGTQGALGSVAAHRSAAVLDHPDGSVTDAKLGSRPVGHAANLPGSPAEAADLTTVLAWLGRSLRDLKGTGTWFDAPAATLGGLHARTLSLEGDRKVIDDGAVSDAKLGPRTLNDAASSDNTATLTGLLSGLAARLRTVTGEASWTALPDTSLAELHQNVARKAADEAVTGRWTFAASPSLPAPSAPGHAATKGYVDTQITAGLGGAGAGAVATHRSAAVLDHPDGSVTGAKLHPNAVTDRLGFTPLGPAGGTLGSITLSAGGGALKLKPGGGDHTFLELYARSGAPGTRSGWVGYGAAGTTELTVINEVGDLRFVSPGRTVVTSPLRVEAGLSVGASVQVTNGYGDTLVLGGDPAGDDYELRLDNPNRPLTFWSPGGQVSVNVVGDLAGRHLRASGQVSAGDQLAAPRVVVADTVIEKAGADLQLAGGTSGVNLRGPRALVNGQNIWHAGNLDPNTFVRVGALASGQLPAHEHDINQVRGLQAALDGKAGVGHGHGLQQVTGLQAALDGKAGVGHRHTFSDLDGRPSTLAGYGITDGNIYDIAGFNPGRPLAGEALLVFVAPRALTLRAAQPGQARARVAASATTTFTVLRGDAVVGSVTFPGGSNVGQVALGGDVALAAGETLTVLAPAGRDNTLADVAVTVAARY